MPVKKKFGALRLGAEESHLRQSAISAPQAAGRGELDPVFQLGKSAFELGTVKLPEEPAGGIEEGSPREENKPVE